MSRPPSPHTFDEEDDFFNDSANDESIIVDGDVLEAAKENIQPLASGRRATSLAGILSTPHALREQRLSSARNRHRINVEIALEDEDDDPLDAYCRFVYWTVENYPQGHSAESGLLELLEEATRVLKDLRDQKFKGDIRYLKLWVLYASYVERPTVIYRYLLANEIGTAHALLYEEFAIILERNGRLTDADSTYLLGINRKASPFDRLQSKHREFQKRMMTSTTFSHASPSNPNAEDDSIPPTETETQPQPKKRVALAEQPRKASHSATGSRTGNQSSRTSSQQAAPSGISARNSRTASSSASTRPALPNARLQVFQDPTPDTPATVSQDENGENDPPEPEPEAKPTPWAELGTRVSRVKENVPEVKKMKGTTLPRAAAGVRGGATRTTLRTGGSRLQIFRDREPTSSEGQVVGEDSTDITKGRDAEELLKEEEPVEKKAKTKISSLSSSSKVMGKDAFFPSRDEDSAPSANAKVATASSSRTTKCPASKLPSPKALGTLSSSSSKPKATFTAFVDSDPTPVDKGKSKVGSAPMSKAKPTVTAPSSSKSAFVPFVDSDAAGTQVKNAKRSAGMSSMKAKPALVPFKDPAPDSDKDACGDDTMASTLKSKPKAGFVPFVDGLEVKTVSSKGKEKEKGVLIAPATPSSKACFTPFRDELPSPGAGGVASENAMKPKKAVLMSSEADALRKDPFKNYKDDEKIMGDELDTE